MKTGSSRREFLKKGSAFCVACGTMALCPGIRSFGMLYTNDVPDPKKLEYCGYTCPPDCKMHQATLKNDPVLKKQAYDEWNLKERYDLEYDPDSIFCHTCKDDEQAVGPVPGNCPVRKCVTDKGYDCCIECAGLKDCSKDLWTRFPDFHRHVLKMQEKYMASL